MSSVIEATEPAQGSEALIPVQTRSERPRSFDPADFGSPTGREVNWKHTPLKPLAALLRNEPAPHDVIGVEVPDQPGALATIMALFRDEGVNIEYLYASLEHSADKAVIVLKVDDVAAGLAMLEKHGYSTVPSF